MSNATGFVENTSRDGKRIQVDGAWYSAYASTQLGGAAKGDYVTFVYTEKASATGGEPFRNIKGEVRKITPPADTAVTGAGVMAAPKAAGGGFVQKQFPVPAFHPDRSIIRQNSLMHATTVLRDRMWSADNCAEYAHAAIDVARIFEAYSTGDMDVEIVESEMKKLLAKE